MAEKVEVKIKETLDVAAIRKDFPILEREVHGKPLVYSDNAATSQKPDAYQANRNLILSDKARADSIPNLEIMANDVRCTHGATVGQIDEEQLFYLMSRGQGRAEATRLIVDGFLHPVLDRVPWARVKARVAGLIREKMSRGMPEKPGVENEGKGG